MLKYQNKETDKEGGASQSQAVPASSISLPIVGGAISSIGNEFTAHLVVQIVHDRGTSLGRGCTVLLSDPSRERGIWISGIIAEAGGSPPIADAAAASVPDELSGRDAIALVAVGSAAEQNQPVLDLIIRLKSAGFNVFAYEDGVKQWPVRSKCLPLLAGATHLLDSTSAAFAVELRRLLHQTLQELAGKHREDQEIRDRMRYHGIVGDSPAITEAFRLAMRFSLLSDLPVLITGDTGTGKELLAQAISRMDPKRKEGPFVTVNCAAVNSALIESEFFGHRRGAFTGAQRDRKGLIRAAEGGTLFLDEIGELGVGLQVKLLRVLQENRVLGVGEEQEVDANVRFIAATNRNLEQLVAERKFRADLYHRLRVLHVHIPPLRDRLSDEPLLIEYFLNEHHALRTDLAPIASKDFLEAVRQLDLPGNVRQLENLVRQSVVNHQSVGDLDLNDLPLDVLRQLTARPQGVVPAPGSMGPDPQVLSGQLPQADMNELVKRILDGQGWNLSSALRECERRVFQAAMDRTQGNQSQAARLLGITARSVYNKLRKYRLPSGDGAGAG